MWLGRLYGRWASHRVVRPIPQDALRAQGVACPVLVVEGLSMGGSGQTPVLLELAHRALQLGLKPGILGHGYGGRCKGFVFEDVAQFGDEAVDCWRRFQGRLPVAVGAAFLPELSQLCDLVLCDGGLWSRRLPRSAQMLVLDATAPFRAFPAGPLRASLDVTSQIDAVWLHKVNEPGAACPECEIHVKSAVRLEAVWWEGQRRDPRWLQGKKMVVICGIARPQSVVHLLQTLGAKIEQVCALPDHATLQQIDFKELLSQKGDAVWVTTSKNFAYWPKSVPDPAVLEIRLSMEGDLGRIDDLLKGAVR